MTLQETFTRVISKDFHGLFALEETSCRYTNHDKCNLCATLSGLERFPIGCWINLSGRSIFKLALSPAQKRGHINCPHNSGRGVIISSRKVSRNCRQSTSMDEVSPQLPANLSTEPKKGQDSPNHHGVRLPWQGEIFVRVSRAKCVQSWPGRVSVLAVLVYRQIPRGAGT